MSTIQKCCQIAKELGEVFEQIKTHCPASTLPTFSAKEGNSFNDYDRKKILKLFNYDQWSNYMKWVDEKLQESGEDLQAFLQASGVESIGPTETQKIEQQSSMQTTKKEGKYHDQSFMTDAGNELKLIETENKKLNKINGELHKKYDELKRKYDRIMK